MIDIINNNIFYILETIGIISFALSGVLLAKKKEFDPIGLYIIGFVTAFGGGTIRDVILGSKPIYWILHSEYPIMILILTIFIYKFKALHIKESWLIIPDALGIALFSITAAQAAEANGLPLIIISILATISATFGGLLRDILCHEVPMLFQKVSFYAFASFLGAWVYIILRLFEVAQTMSMLIALIFILFFRLLSYRYNWKFK